MATDLDRLLQQARQPEAVQRTWMGTEEVDGEELGSFDLRIGRCYELAALAVMLSRTPRLRLVHGSIHNDFHSHHGRIGHAWALLPDGKVWEPIFGMVFEAGDWQGYANPKIERIYHRWHAIRLMHNTQHYGPWTTSEAMAARNG